MDEWMNATLNGTSCHFDVINIKLPIYRSLMIVGYIITSVISIFLNSLVIISIWKTPSLHKPSYILLANLGFTDLVVGLISDPTMVITNVAALNNWTDVFCLTWMIGRLCGYYMAAMSLFTLTLISVDRLCAIHLKTRYRSLITSSRVIGVLVIWYCFAFTAAILVKATNADITPTASFVSCYIFTLLAIITTCYSLCFRKLKKLAMPIRTESNQPSEQPKRTLDQSDFHVQTYRRSLNTMLLVFLIIMLFCFPYLCAIGTTAVIYFTVPNAPQSQYRILTYHLVTMGELMIFVNSSVNPVLYLWRMKDLRAAASTKIRPVFHCFSCLHSSVSDSVHGSSNDHENTPM